MNDDDKLIRLADVMAVVTAMAGANEGVTLRVGGTSETATVQDVADAIAALPAAQVAVKPLVWGRYWPGCYTVKSLKEADNGCDVVFYAEKSEVNGYIINTVTKPGYFRCWMDWGDEYPTIEAAKAAAQADYEARIRAALDVGPAPDVAGLVEAAQWARNRLEVIADDAWHGDGRDFKRALVGVFADFDEALARHGSFVPSELVSKSKPRPTPDAVLFGPWPKAPDGARVSPPSYEMHPFSVTYVFGSGWGLYRQLPASGASAKVSGHNSAQDALDAMVAALAKLEARNG